MLRSKRIKEFVSPVYFHGIPLIFVSSLYLACCKQSCGLHQNNLKSISFIRIILLFEAFQRRSLSNYQGSLHPLCFQFFKGLHQRENVNFSRVFGPLPLREALMKTGHRMFSKDAPSGLSMLWREDDQKDAASFQICTN